MNFPIKNIGLVAKLQSPAATDALQTLIYHLQRRDLRLMLHQGSGEALPQSTDLPIVDTETLGGQCDLIIVIGGDGTLLRTARLLARYEARLVGINLGRLGFLADIKPTEMTTDLDAILNGNFLEEKRFLIQATAFRGKTVLTHCSAVNDIVIHKWNTTHLFGFTTHINKCLLGHQRADGVLISTPTGSTAYCLSGGGPIVHPSLNVLILLLLLPHTLSHAPLVLDSDNEIEVTLQLNQEVEAQLTCDGEASQTLLPGDRVTIQRHRHIYLIHPPNHDHYATLRDKLLWGYQP
jgi:NAD+ kinase